MSCVVFLRQKTAYEVRISDWSSDGCSADLRRGSEIGVGAGLGPADASAELIELGEAEAVGAVDDEGVRRGDVEAAFDDGRRKEHIIFAVVEGRHALLDLGGRPLTAGADEGDLGYLDAEELLDVRRVGEARGDEIALAAAIMFAEQRLADDHRIPWHDIGAHR